MLRLACRIFSKHQHRRLHTPVVVVVVVVVQNVDQCSAAQQARIPEFEQ
jgi:hypothetical protein